LSSFINRRYKFFNVATQKACLPWAITSGVEPSSMPITGVPVAIDSTITKPKGSRQVMGNKVATAPPIKAVFCSWVASPKYSICLPSI